MKASLGSKNADKCSNFSAHVLAFLACSRAENYCYNLPWATIWQWFFLGLSCSYISNYFLSSAILKTWIWKTFWSYRAIIVIHSYKKKHSTAYTPWTSIYTLNSVQSVQKMGIKAVVDLIALYPYNTPIKALYASDPRYRVVPLYLKRGRAYLTIWQKLKPRCKIYG